MQAKSGLIQLNNLGLDLNHRRILTDITVDIQPDEILTVIGPNGAGKSSLVKCLIGLYTPTRGSIVRRPNLKMGYTPQRVTFEKSMPLTADQFLRLGQPKSADSSVFLEEVGAEHLKQYWMYDLSGGELQRVLLARALSQKPDLLILDEPAAGVDLTGQAEVYRLLASIRNRHHCGIVVVSHDLRLVMAETDKVVCLNKHICCSGRPEIVAKDPAFAEMFGEQAAGLALYRHHHDHDHLHDHSVPEGAKDE